MRRARFQAPEKVCRDLRSNNIAHTASLCGQSPSADVMCSRRGWLQSETQSKEGEPCP